MKGRVDMDHQTGAATVVATKLSNTSQTHERVRRPSYAMRQQAAEH
jgi:hypothetical protein